jgi:23S rRNA (uridine2552-2'-O)-methyltransferase
MSYNPKDHYFHKAKQEGFVARSAYKLEEIQKKHKLIKPGQRVLDLGCSPGSWSQVALKLVGKDGFVVGIDLKPVKIQAANAKFIVGDILQTDPSVFGEPFDVIISDMAPNTTGIRIRDQALSEELCRMALTVAEKYLKPGGHLVMKLFEGPDGDKLAKEMKPKFAKFDRLKPAAVRKGSFETYIVGIGKK